MDDSEHKMKRPNMRKLQSLINKTARTNNVAYRAEAALAEYVEKIYGCTWSDIDADEIIDGVTGGEGAAPGMDAKYFDQVMRDSIEATHG